VPSWGAPPLEPDGRGGDPLALTGATSSLALSALQTGLLAMASTLFDRTRALGGQALLECKT
jgi:hypothetical protein